jgi:NMT1-like family
LFAEGKIDAFMGFPPEPQELRAKKIGHMVVSTALDRPWSQYFCCMLVGNRAFVRGHPMATKRALRAILKAADVCALDPDRAARLLVDNGYTESYGYARQTMQEVPYDKWREYNPEGHPALLCPAPAGGQDDHVEPPEDHRAGHRLALPHRAEAGAEGLSAPRSVVME